MIYTLAAGVVALAAEALLILDLLPAGPARQAEAGFAAVIGVTIAGALTAHFRQRRDPELNNVRTIADVTQRVLLRPLPGQVGQVRKQFITAILAEVNQDGSKIDIINCGHPQPLQLGPEGPRLLGPADGGLPLGFGALAAAERVPFTITLRAGEPVLFYTDGLTEARNRAGDFFPLTECASVQSAADPHTLLERLSAEVSRYVSRQAHDDMALLVVRRQPP